MEVYRNELANVDLLVPVTAIGNNIDVTAYNGSTLLYTFSTVSAITGGYRVVLPFSLVDSDRDFIVKWQFNYSQDSSTKQYSRSIPIRVVTPYFTLAEVKAAIPEASAISDSELKELEGKIRGVIEGYTGQNFGNFIGDKVIIGSGDGELKLPQRLDKMSAIQGANVRVDPDGIGYVDFYSILGDGWFIGSANPSPSGYVEYDNIIHPPLACIPFTFKDNMFYTISGTWGYADIPADVKRAALILAESYICPQTEYRDRYLKSISGEGWRYEFNPNAYYGTGSVIADQLLDQFRRNMMTVI